MTLKTKAFDVAEHLTGPEVIAAYLTEALEAGDCDFIAQAIGTAVRGMGMDAVAKATGLERERLYREFNAGGNPELGTVMKVLDAIGIRLTVLPKA